MAGVPRIAAISEDYPGSLLDVRHRLDEDMPEAERNLSLARAAGFALPAGDAGRLAVRRLVCPDRRELAGGGPYVVVHASASVPARAPSASRVTAIVAALAAAGYRVVVTGSAAERSPAVCGHPRGGRGAGGGGPGRPDQPAARWPPCWPARTWWWRRTPARPTWPPRWAPRW